MSPQSESRPAPPPFTAAAVQMDVEPGESDSNLSRMAGFARDAAGREADLVVFPECSLTGYCLGSREEARELAEPVPGPAVLRTSALCRELGIHVIFGLIEARGERLHNTVVLVGPSGLLARYRKVHLPHVGVDRFLDPGEEAFAVHETSLCRLGMNICYDGGFPEPARVLALDGADLITLPTNWPRGAEAFARHAVPTRALENTVYYLASSRVGEERGTRFIGLSSICDPSGEVLASADQVTETVLVARIDPARARDKTIVRVPGEHIINRIADRRPEFYRRLVDPYERGTR